MPICALYLIWPRDPLLCQIFLNFPIFEGFFLLFKLIKGVIQYSWSKNSWKHFLLKFIRMTKRVLSPPSTTVHIHTFIMYILHVRFLEKKITVSVLILRDFFASKYYKSTKGCSIAVYIFRYIKKKCIINNTLK